MVRARAAFSAVVNVIEHVVLHVGVSYPEAELRAPVGAQGELVAVGDAGPHQGGVAIMDAKDLHFEKKGSLIRITSKDSEGRENETTVSLRSEESGVAL